MVNRSLRRLIRGPELSMVLRSRRAIENDGAAPLARLGSLSQEVDEPCRDVVGAHDVDSERDLHVGVCHALHRLRELR